MIDPKILSEIYELCKSGSVVLSALDAGVALNGSADEDFFKFEDPLGDIIFKLEGSILTATCTAECDIDVALLESDSVDESETIERIGKSRIAEILFEYSLEAEAGVMLIELGSYTEALVPFDGSKIRAGFALLAGVLHPLERGSNFEFGPMTAAVQEVLMEVDAWTSTQILTVAYSHGLPIDDWVTATHTAHESGRGFALADSRYYADLAAGTAAARVRIDGSDTSVQYELWSSDPNSITMPLRNFVSRAVLAALVSDLVGEHGLEQHHLDSLMASFRAAQ